MSKVSIIIPARAEGPALPRTVADVYAHATGDVEVLVGFDGPPYQDFPDHPGLRVFRMPELVGLKALINGLAQAATGEYLFKLDAHCSVAQGFDETLAADTLDNWIVTPRFYVLDGATWQWQDDRFYDAFYLSCPFTDPKGFRFKAGGHWPERTHARLHISIDATPQIHGSAWFVSRAFFLNCLGGFPATDPFGHAQEPPYLGLKTWLGPWGGRVMVNKKTHYAHMHQQGNRRGYHMSKAQEQLSYDLTARYWVGDQWADRAHDFSWFVEKFMPMPTWPSNWREQLDNWKLGLK